LPVFGAETARKVLDPKFDPNVSEQPWSLLLDRGSKLAGAVILSKQEGTAKRALRAAERFRGRVLGEADSV